MIRYALPLAAAAVVAQPLAAAEIQIAVQNPVIELAVTESVTGDPDLATISAGVTTVASTAVEAMQQNARQMERVIAQIEALGVDEDDIQTTGINLNAEYDWDEQTRQQRFRGYRASNRVSVKLRDIERTGRVLDSLVAAGATDLNGPAWSIDDPTPAQDQARTAAFATGMERARDYARMAGYSDVRLLEVSESFSSQPMPQMAARVRTMDIQETATPVRPGQVETGITLQLKYEMVR